MQKESRLHTLFFLLLLIGICLCTVCFAASKEIHFVVDLSKSNALSTRMMMIKTFINRVPNGTIAGIWTVGKHVKQVVPASLVNDTWRRRARQQMNQIRFVSSYNNLADGLDDVTNHWRPELSRKARKIILLSDGIVHISPDDNDNRREVQFILSEILPRLQRNKISLHAITPTWRYNTVLLNPLTRVNQGWIKQPHEMNSSNWHALLGTKKTRVATRAKSKKHQQLATRRSDSKLKPPRTQAKEKPPTEKKTTLSLASNTQKVNAQTVIKQIAINKPNNQLIFYIQTGADASLSIIAPNGNTCSQNKHCHNVTWLYKNTFYQCVIQQPAQGTWTVMAENASLPVTALIDPELKLSSVDKLFFQGETIRVDMLLLSAGQPVKEKLHHDFTIRLSHQISQNKPMVSQVKLQQSAHYSFVLAQPQQIGKQILVAELLLEGTEILTRLPLEITKNPINWSLARDDDNSLAVAFDIDQRLVDAKSVQMTINLIDENNESIEKMKLIGLSLPVPDTFVAKRHRLQIKVEGKTAWGRAFSLSFDDHSLSKAIARDIKAQEQAKQPKEIGLATQKQRENTATVEEIQTDKAQLLDELDKDLSTFSEQHEMSKQSIASVNTTIDESSEKGSKEIEKMNGDSTAENHDNASAPKTEEIDRSLQDNVRDQQPGGSGYTWIFALLLVFGVNMACFWGGRTLYTTFKTNEAEQFMKMKEEILS